ncbi:substrate-binding domain-containing protein [Nonomuraea angiospora]|uniref:ABC-type sugar transport system substrate-binding protein n=1 Tax=Nonomuraea angiospora TaxID=46172 RepID=A0ABR9MKN2_9ACTN|nr:substrate-binding domain-containing protein [Nonomuraea angiospora]MBE1593468.1 ABC-type sugar transport system substrate-binding protein [Nonomuraea angiospora]
MRSLAFVIAGVALGAAACGASASSESAADLTIGLSVSTMSNPYFVQFRDGAEAAAQRFGAKLSVSDAQNDASRQAAQVQGFTSRRMRAVIINPVDSNALATQVKAANLAGIPVIAADRAINHAWVAETLTSDNAAGGRLGAQELAKQIDGKGDVVVLRGTAGTSASRDRSKGFDDGLAAYPKIKVVATQRADFDRAKGQNVMTGLIRSHPGLDGVFAENDEMALGAIQALGPKAGHRVKVVGFDGTPDGIKAVRAGTMAATVTQQPRLIGWQAVQDAIKAARGQTVAKTVAVPVKLATKENAHEFWTF